MDRLTRKRGNVICKHEQTDCNDSCMNAWCRWSDKAFKKLCEYEDTDFTPTEVMILKSDYILLKSKLEPKEPLYTDYEDEMQCPCCGEVVDESDSPIQCYKCQQVLDWRDI